MERCPTCGRLVASIFEHLDLNCDELPDEMETIEYAGFHYQMVMGLHGQAVMAIPLPGQHKAAGKGKHCRAATEMFNQRKADA